MGTMCSGHFNCFSPSLIFCPTEEMKLLSTSSNIPHQQEAWTKADLLEVKAKGYGLTVGKSTVKFPMPIVFDEENTYDIPREWINEHYRNTKFLNNKFNGQVLDEHGFPNTPPFNCNDIYEQEEVLNIPQPSSNISVV